MTHTGFQSGNHPQVEIRDTILLMSSTWRQHVLQHLDEEWHILQVKDWDTGNCARFFRAGGSCSATATWPETSVPAESGAATKGFQMIQANS